MTTGREHPPRPTSDHDPRSHFDVEGELREDPPAAPEADETPADPSEVEDLGEDLVDRAEAEAEDARAHVDIEAGLTPQERKRQAELDLAILQELQKLQNAIDQAQYEFDQAQKVSWTSYIPLDPFKKGRQRKRADALRDLDRAKSAMNSFLDKNNLAEFEKVQKMNPDGTPALDREGNPIWERVADDETGHAKMLSKKELYQIHLDKQEVAELEAELYDPERSITKKRKRDEQYESDAAREADLASKWETLLNKKEVLEEKIAKKLGASFSAWLEHKISSDDLVTEKMLKKEYPFVKAYKALGEMNLSKTGLGRNIDTTTRWGRMKAGALKIGNVRLLTSLALMGAATIAAGPMGAVATAGVLRTARGVFAGLMGGAGAGDIVGSVQSAWHNRKIKQLKRTQTKLRAAQPFYARLDSTTTTTEEREEANIHINAIMGQPTENYVEWPDNPDNSPHTPTGSLLEAVRQMKSDAHNNGRTLAGDRLYQELWMEIGRRKAKELEADGTTHEYAEKYRTLITDMTREVRSDFRRNYEKSAQSSRRYKFIGGALMGATIGTGAMAEIVKGGADAVANAAHFYTGYEPGTVSTFVGNIARDVVHAPAYAAERVAEMPGDAWDATVDYMQSPARMPYLDLNRVDLNLNAEWGKKLVFDGDPLQYHYSEEVPSVRASYDRSSTYVPHPSDYTRPRFEFDSIDQVPAERLAEHPLTLHELPKDVHVTASDATVSAMKEKGIAFAAGTVEFGDGKTISFSPDVRAVHVSVTSNDTILVRALEKDGGITMHEISSDGKTILSRIEGLEVGTPNPDDAPVNELLAPEEVQLPPGEELSASERRQWRQFKRNSFANGFLPEFGDVTRGVRSVDAVLSSWIDGGGDASTAAWEQLQPKKIAEMDEAAQWQAYSKAYDTLTPNQQRALMEAYDKLDADRQHMPDLAEVKPGRTSYQYRLKYYENLQKEWTQLFTQHRMEAINPADVVASERAPVASVIAHVDSGSVNLSSAGVRFSPEAAQAFAEGSGMEVYVDGMEARFDSDGSVNISGTMDPRHTGTSFLEPRRLPYTQALTEGRMRLFSSLVTMHERMVDAGVGDSPQAIKLKNMITEQGTLIQQEFNGPLNVRDPHLRPFNIPDAPQRVVSDAFTYDEPPMIRPERYEFSGRFDGGLSDFGSMNEAFPKVPASVHEWSDGLPRMYIHFESGGEPWQVNKKEFSFGLFQLNSDNITDFVQYAKSEGYPHASEMDQILRGNAANARSARFVQLWEQLGHNDRAAFGRIQMDFLNEQYIPERLPRAVSMEQFRQMDPALQAMVESMLVHAGFAYNSEGLDTILLSGASTEEKIRALAEMRAGTIDSKFATALRTGQATREGLLSRIRQEAAMYLDIHHSWEEYQMNRPPEPPTPPAAIESAPPVSQVPADAAPVEAPPKPPAAPAPEPAAAPLVEPAPAAERPFGVNLNRMLTEAEAERFAASTKTQMNLGDGTRVSFDSTSGKIEIGIKGGPSGSSDTEAYIRIAQQMEAHNLDGTPQYEEVQRRLQALQAEAPAEGARARMDEMFTTMDHSTAVFENLNDPALTPEQRLNDLKTLLQEGNVRMNGVVFGLSTTGDVLVDPGGGPIRVDTRNISAAGDLFDLTQNPQYLLAHREEMQEVLNRLMNTTSTG